MTDNEEFYLLRRIPKVLRARGFRLYLSNGDRLVDLWLNGGAAVLGHTPANMLRELKNTASRGLYPPYPHFTEGRFIKALSKIFPGRSFRLYAAPPPQLAMFAENANLNEAAQSGAIDKKNSCCGSVNIKIWRPYADPAHPFAADDAALLVPALPGIQTWRGGLPLGLCAAAINTACGESEKISAKLPPGDPLSPVLLAVAARGLQDILASPLRAKPALPRVMKVLKALPAAQNRGWRRRGIYLSLKREMNTEEWAALFNQFLEAGFLPPPSPDYPLILPGELSKGEDAKLAEALSRF